MPIVKECLRCGKPFDTFPSEGRIFCSVTCHRRHQIELPPSVRFWRRVDKNGPVPRHRPELGACWIWTGARDARGYGNFSTGGMSPRTVKASRFALEEDLGRALTGFALHQCDNPPCVNPAHLFEGDHDANMADMVSKGRVVTRLKLTEDDVREIRRRRSSGETLVSLGAVFDVSHYTIRQVASGRTWRSVE